MKLGEFLRRSRIEAGLTQESMADKVGVSTTSVQNWEKNTFPDPQYWPLISQALSVDVTDIVACMAETVVPPKEEKSRKTCPFPEFLFPEESLPHIKALRFTDEEMELLGMELVCNGGNYHALSCNANLPALPYEYIRLKGTWNILGMHEAITDKLSKEHIPKVADWAKVPMLADWAKKHPGKSFDILDQTPEDYLSFCKYIRLAGSSAYGGWPSKERSQFELICQDLKYADLYTDNCTDLPAQVKEKIAAEILRECKKNDDPHWNQKTPEQIIAEWRVVETTSGRYSSGWEPTALHQRQWEDTEFLTLRTIESEDAEYLAAKHKYEEDMKFYNEHMSMLDYPPSQPKFQGKRIITLTEKGKKIYNWLKVNNLHLLDY